MAATMPHFVEHVWPTSTLPTFLPWFLLSTDNSRAQAERRDQIWSTVPEGMGADDQQPVLVKFQGVRAHVSQDSQPLVHGLLSHLT